MEAFPDVRQSSLSAILLPSRMHLNKGENMLYQICHGAVSFADEEILHDINFEIRNTEKIAVVGTERLRQNHALKADPRGCGAGQKRQ